MDDDAPEILDLFFTYHYPKDCSVPNKLRGASRHLYCNVNLLVHAQVHTIADKYRVTELVDLFVSKFKVALEEHYLHTSDLGELKARPK